MAASDLETEAHDIGQRIGSSDAEAIGKGWMKVENDHLHHPGDDTGRLMWAAYDSGGVSAAVDVLDAYLTAYNAQRTRASLPVITRETVRDTLGWAVSMRNDRAAIRAMRDEYADRHGLGAPRRGGRS